MFQKFIVFAFVQHLRAQTDNREVQIYFGHMG